MQLLEFNADDADACTAYAAIMTASTTADAPWMQPTTPYAVALSAKHGWDGDPGRYFLGRGDGGTPVVGACLDGGTYDNLTLGWLTLVVHPDHRRQGHGSAALASLEDVARTAGRTLAGSDGWERPSTTGFARAHGYGQKAIAVNRRMRVDRVDPAHVAAAYDDAAARAADYELLRCARETPADLLDALATAATAINDAPHDDLEMEDDVITVDRVRAYERAQLARGHRLYRVVARHRGTAEIGGHTVVAVDAEAPRYADQHDTSVVAAHRGHRLGLLLKASMVQWLAEAEPELRSIDTWNAESNDHMIAVNERLGYEAMGRSVMVQRHL